MSGASLSLNPVEKPVYEIYSFNNALVSSSEINGMQNFCNMLSTILEIKHVTIEMRIKNGLKNRSNHFRNILEDSNSYMDYENYLTELARVSNGKIILADIWWPGKRNTKLAFVKTWTNKNGCVTAISRCLIKPSNIDVLFLEYVFNTEIFSKFSS